MFLRLRSLTYALKETSSLHEDFKKIYRDKKCKHRYTPEEQDRIPEAKECKEIKHIRDILRNLKAFEKSLLQKVDYEFKQYVAKRPGESKHDG